jgi:protein MpaA
VRALSDLIGKFQPAGLVSIHQPLACVDYDGPAAELAAAMSAACDLPVKRLGSRPGSPGAYFGEILGRPIITLELPKNPNDPAVTYLGALAAAGYHVHGTSAD